MRARRSCLSVPGSSPKMLSKAPALPADEVFMDLEDSVAPLAKEEARGNVIDALKNNDWGEKTVVVRINSIDTQWAADDLKTLVENAGQYIDCIMVPKVQHAHEVMFVDHMLRMIETTRSVSRSEIGIEAQIETATGLKNVHEIAHSSERLETLIFGPGRHERIPRTAHRDRRAPDAGLPGRPLPLGARDDPGSGALRRAAGDRRAVPVDQGPRRISAKAAMRARALGYDGKWALHPGQIDVLNEVFTPTQEEFDKAEAVLEAYKHATEVERTGAVMFGNEMIDEASRKMAIQFAERGHAAGMKVESTSRTSRRNGRPSRCCN